MAWRILPGGHDERPALDDGSADGLAGGRHDPAGLDRSGVCRREGSLHARDRARGDGLGGDAFTVIGRNAGFADFLAL